MAYYNPPSPSPSPSASSTSYVAYINSSGMMRIKSVFDGEILAERFVHDTATDYFAGSICAMARSIILSCRNSNRLLVFSLGAAATSIELVLSLCDVRHSCYFGSFKDTCLAEKLLLTTENELEGVIISCQLGASSSSISYQNRYQQGSKRYHVIIT